MSMSMRQSFNSTAILAMADGAPPLASATLRRTQALRERLRREAGRRAEPGTRRRYSIDRDSPSRARANALATSVHPAQLATFSCSSARPSSTASASASASAGVIPGHSVRPVTLRNSPSARTTTRPSEGSSRLSSPPASPLSLDAAFAPGADELSTLLEVAVSLGLTTHELTVRMRANVQSGKFSREHYLRMWSERIAAAEAERRHVESTAAEAGRPQSADPAPHPPSSPRFEHAAVPANPPGSCPDDVFRAAATYSPIQGEGKGVFGNVGCACNPDAIAGTAPMTDASAGEEVCAQAHFRSSAESIPPGGQSTPPPASNPCTQSVVAGQDTSTLCLEVNGKCLPNPTPDVYCMQPCAVGLSSCPKSSEAQAKPSTGCGSLERHEGSIGPSSFAAPAVSDRLTKMYSETSQIATTSPGASSSAAPSQTVMTHRADPESDQATAEDGATLGGGSGAADMCGGQQLDAREAVSSERFVPPKATSSAYSNRTTATPASDVPSCAIITLGMSPRRTAPIVHLESGSQPSASFDADGSVHHHLAGAAARVPPVAASDTPTIQHPFTARETATDSLLAEGGGSPIAVAPETLMPKSIVSTSPCTRSVRIVCQKVDDEASRPAGESSRCWTRDAAPGDPMGEAGRRKSDAQPRGVATVDTRLEGRGVYNSFSTTSSRPRSGPTPSDFMCRELEAIERSGRPPRISDTMLSIICALEVDSDVPKAGCPPGPSNGPDRRNGAVADLCTRASRPGTSWRRGGQAGNATAIRGRATYHRAASVSEDGRVTTGNHEWWSLAGVSAFAARAARAVGAAADAMAETLESTPWSVPTLTIDGQHTEEPQIGMTPAQLTLLASELSAATGEIARLKDELKLARVEMSRLQHELHSAGGVHTGTS